MDLEPSNDDDNLEALSDLSTLVDPVRRRLYDHVAAQSEPVSREDAAAATGVSRTLAAYHLDKLSDAGLVEAHYARPPGRTGPGAGRPAKRYVRANRELSISVPSRSYLLIAEVLAEAVAADAGGMVRAAAARAARRTGHAAGADHGLEPALLRCGYEPARTDDGDVVMRNCPFHHLSTAHTTLICGINLDLIEGVLEGAGEPIDRAELAPQDGRCCVVIHPADREPTGASR